MMKRLRKVLPNNEKTKKYLDSLPKIYLVACWAKYGVMEFPFSGKYKDKEHLQPLVWQYDDLNGTSDNWYLKSIEDTTTGSIYLWTFSKEDAYRIAKKKNVEIGESLRNE